VSIKNRDGSLTITGTAAALPDGQVGIMLADLAVRASMLIEKYRDEGVFLAKENARLEAQVKRLSEQLDSGDDTA
jgi:hypothetical protein